jgi:hypothetical protein
MNGSLRRIARNVKRWSLLAPAERVEPVLEPLVVPVSTLLPLVRPPQSTKASSIDTRHDHRRFDEDCSITRPDSHTSVGEARVPMQLRYAGEPVSFATWARRFAIASIHDLRS